MFTANWICHIGTRWSVFCARLISHNVQLMVPTMKGTYPSSDALISPHGQHLLFTALSILQNRPARVGNMKTHWLKQSQARWTFLRQPCSIWLNSCAKIFLKLTEGISQLQNLFLEAEFLATQPFAKTAGGPVELLKPRKLPSSSEKKSSHALAKGWFFGLNFTIFVFSNRFW